MDEKKKDENKNGISGLDIIFIVVASLIVINLILAAIRMMTDNTTVYQNTVENNYMNTVMSVMDEHGFDVGKVKNPNDNTAYCGDITEDSAVYQGTFSGDDTPREFQVDIDCETDELNAIYEVVDGDIVALVTMRNVEPM